MGTCRHRQGFAVGTSSALTVRGRVDDQKPLFFQRRHASRHLGQLRSGARGQSQWPRRGARQRAGDSGAGGGRVPRAMRPPGGAGAFCLPTGRISGASGSLPPPPSRPRGEETRGHLRGR